jgi:hypothetical protein
MNKQNKTIIVSGGLLIKIFKVKMHPESIRLPILGPPFNQAEEGVSNNIFESTSP